MIKDDTVTGDDVDESTLIITHLEDADNDTKVQVEKTSDEDKIRFDTDGVERMIITETGKVGIGNNITPGYKLDVDGDVKIRGNDIRDSSGDKTITFDGNANVIIPNELEVGVQAAVTGSIYVRNTSTQSGGAPPAASLYLSNQSAPPSGTAGLANSIRNQFVNDADGRFSSGWNIPAVAPGGGGQMVVISATSVGTQFDFSNTNTVNGGGGQGEIIVSVSNSNGSSTFSSLKITVMGGWNTIPNGATLAFDVDADGTGGTETFTITFYDVNSVGTDSNGFSSSATSTTYGTTNYINFDHSTNASFVEGQNGFGFRSDQGNMEYKDIGGSWRQFNSLAVGPQAPDRAVQFNNNGDLGSGNFFYGSNANVGIGDFSSGDSDYLLHVKGNSGHTGNAGELTVSDRSSTDHPGVNFIREGGDGGLIQSVSDGDALGRVSFLGRNSGGTNTEGARIESHAAVDSGNVGGELAFQVKTPAGTLENKLVIKNDGVITLPDGRNYIDSTNDNGGIALNQKLQFRVNGTEVGAVSVDGIQSDVLYSKGVIGHVGVIGQNASSFVTNDQRTECFQYSTSNLRPHTDFVTDSLSTQTLGASTAVWDTVFANTVQNVTGSSMFAKSDESMTLQINQTGDHQRWGTNGGSGAPVEFKLQANYATSFDGQTNAILGTTPRDFFSFQSTGTNGANGTVSIGSSLLYLDSGIKYYGDIHQRYFQALGSGYNNVAQLTNYMGGSYYGATRFWNEDWYISREDANGDSQHELAWKEIIETQTPTSNQGNPQVTKRFGHAHSGNFQETFRFGSGGAFIFGDTTTTTGFTGDAYGRAHLGFVPQDASAASSVGAPLMTISVYDDESVPGRNITNSALNAYNTGYSDEYQETFRMMVKPQSGYVSTDTSNIGNSFHIELMKDNSVGLQEQFTIDSTGRIGLGDSTPSSSHKVSIGGDLFVDGAVDAQGLRFNTWYNESSSTPSGALIKFNDSNNDLVLNSSHNFDTVIMGGTTSNEIFKVDNESENVYMRGTVFIGNHTDVDVSGSLGTGETTDQGCVPSPGGLYAPNHLKHKSALGWPYDATDYNNDIGPVLYVENTAETNDKPVATFVNTHRSTDADGIEIIIGKEINTHESYPSGFTDNGVNPLPSTNNSFVSFRSPTINVDVDDNLLDTVGTNTFWNGLLTVGRIGGDGAEGIRIFGDTFTGTHDSCSTSDIEIGMIVESTGQMWIKNNISTALPMVTSSTTKNSKTAYGVVSSKEINSGRACRVKDSDFPLTINSLGEGCVWVTNLEGEPTNGDYITSSPISGHGQLQDDDILHSYTVAKLTEAIDWSKVTDVIEHEGVQYKKYLAGCTYHCG